MNLTRESIFVNAVRSFCTSFATILGIVIGIAVIAMFISLLSGPTYLPDRADPVILPDARGERTLLSGNSPAVLKIDIHGVVGMNDLTAQKIRDILYDSREDFLRGDRVKAILLHVDTPGGTVTDADGIYRLLMEYKTKHNIPIYAFVDGLCASGGMYIVSAADKVYASPASTIGSIGVILGPTFNFSEAMAKVGIASLTLTEGKDKDALNPFRPWKPDEDASLKAIIACMYDRFVNIVTAARTRLDKQKLTQDYGAQVYISEVAEKLGYIDNGSADYRQTLSDLVQVAGIKEAEKYQVIQLVLPKPLLPDLIQGKFPNGKVTHTFELGPYFSSELSGKLLYLYAPGT